MCWSQCLTLLTELSLQPIHLIPYGPWLNTAILGPRFGLCASCSCSYDRYLTKATLTIALFGSWLRRCRLSPGRGTVVGMACSVVAGDYRLACSYLSDRMHRGFELEMEVDITFNPFLSARSYIPKIPPTSRIASTAGISIQGHEPVRNILYLINTWHQWGYKFGSRGQI